MLMKYIKIFRAGKNEQRVLSIAYLIDKSKK
jgi:hypothetical protein